MASTLKSRRLFGFLFPFCLFLIAAAPTFSQTEEAEPFAESIDVERVNVDVWVTDRAGEPIRGLPASAFRISHNGEPVTVENFSELGPEQADTAVGQPSGEATDATADSAAAPVQDSNYLVLYLDQLRLENRDFAPTLEAIRPLLEDPALVPEHVLIVRQDIGLFVEANLGSKRPELLAAIDAMGQTNVAGLQASNELDQALESLRLEWRQSQDQAQARGNAISSIPTIPGEGGGGDGARGAIGGDFGPNACDLFVQRAGVTVDGWARSQARRTAISLDFLSRTATFLAGLPGVKTVLYISGGLETRPGSALTDYVTGLCPGGEALFSVDSLGEEMSASFMELTRHFNSNRVTIYPFKAGQLRSSSAGSASTGGDAGGVDTFRARGSFEQRQRSQALGGLGLLAGETGGRLLTRGDQMAQLAGRLATRYSLAYAPPASRGTEVRVKVELADSATSEPVEVRHRRSFLEKTPDQRLAELVDGALFLGLVENSLELRLGAGDLQPKGDRWLLPLRIQVPVETLSFNPASKTPATTLSVRVLARHLESGQLTSAENSFRIKQPEGQVAAGSRAQLPINLELPPGPTSIAVGVRDGISGVSSVVSTALEVGPPPTR